MTESPNFYAIIPATVRYDKNLCANAKLLYGEITALTHKTGYCWATNKYFADLYDVTTRSIKSWIASLEANGHIKTQMVTATKRRIMLHHISPSESESSCEESPEGVKESSPVKKSSPRGEEKFTHNNTYTNTSLKDISKEISKSKPISRKTKGIHIARAETIEVREFVHLTQSQIDMLNERYEKDLLEIMLDKLNIEQSEILDGVRKRKSPYTYNIFNKHSWLWEASMETKGKISRSGKKAKSEAPPKSEYSHVKFKEYT